MTQDSAVAEIFCDESGHDGENLMAGTTPVLAHSSLYMDLAEATDLVAYLRKKTRAQSLELKASAVLRNSQAIDELFGVQGKLVGHVQVYLVEKASLVAGKMIDLLVEEKAHAAGIDLYTNGYAKHIADELYQYGPHGLGEEQWLNLVAAFTSLMREKQRKGGEKETTEGFFEKVEQARLNSTHPRLKFILTLLSATRRQAEEFQADVAKGGLTKNLDPLQTSLMELAYAWSQKLKKPIRIMHDAQNGLTEQVMKAVMAASNEEIPKEFNLPNRHFDLVEIRHIDSKSDPRIQLADVAAGFTRQVSESALKGTADNKHLAQVQRLVHYNSIWGDGESWEQIRPRG
jgi:hypothetical protein